MSSSPLRCLFAVIALGLWPQTVDAGDRDSIVDLLLQAADVPVNPKAYTPDVASELNKYLQRYKAYRPKRPRPMTRGLDEMVYSAWVAYERKLAASSSDPKAPALAAAYVDRLRPCYEWEGFHECPEREAQFAAAYLKADPEGPFSEYLPLFAAHRWLCAAEGYEYEKQPTGAARSRREYQAAISQARKSKALLIRFAAERLAERNSCFARH